MDNDNKIIVSESSEEKRIHNEVMLFLGDELNSIHKSKTGQIYDIDKEFEKTKNNKSPFAIILLACCLVAIVSLAFITHKIISNKNQEIAVSLEEFNDLNLRALLDTVSSAQNNYDNAVKNKAQLQADMESRIKAADDTFENDIYVIDSMHLKSKKVYNDRVEVAKKNYEETLKNIEEEFADQLILAEKQVQEYKAMLAEFDTAKVESARMQEKALDSERQLRDLETKKLTDKYEKRISELESSLRDSQKRSSEAIRNAVSQVSKQYQHEIDLLDPTLKDSTATDIIQDAKNIKTPDFNGAEILLRNSIYSEKVISFVNKYQNIYDDFKYLDDVVASIPQKNSIPKYVSSARILVNDMGEAFVGTTISFYEENVKLSGTVDSLNRKITTMDANHKTEMSDQKNLYENTMANILTLAKTNAVILSATDYESIKIYVAPKARYLITEEGSPAELRLGKAIKGKIFRNEEDFYFEVEPDKDGNIPEIDFEAIEPGTAVKILSK